MVARGDDGRKRRVSGASSGGHGASLLRRCAQLPYPSSGQGHRLRQHGTAVLLRLSLAGSSRFAPGRQAPHCVRRGAALTLSITGADVGDHRRRSGSVVADDRRLRDSAIPPPAPDGVEGARRTRPSLHQRLHQHDDRRDRRRGQHRRSHAAAVHVALERAAEGEADHRAGDAARGPGPARAGPPRPRTRARRSTWSCRRGRTPPASRGAPGRPLARRPARSAGRRPTPRFPSRPTPCPRPPAPAASARASSAGTTRPSPAAPPRRWRAAASAPTSRPPATRRPPCPAAGPRAPTAGRGCATAPRSRQQASALSGRFTSSRGTGTNAGSTSVSSGAETSAMPNPTVPCAAAAAMAIAVARTSSSAPSTPVAAGGLR